MTATERLAELERAFSLVLQCVATDDRDQAATIHELVSLRERVRAHLASATW